MGRRIIRRKKTKTNGSVNSRFNERGQIIVEAVLLIGIGIIVILGFVKHLKETDFAGRIIANPWAKLQGMIECGVWQDCGVGKRAPGLHPNARSRLLSLDNSSE
jgi:hypothetical protein